MRWCVLQCKPNRTEWAAINLREQGFKVLAPRLRLHKPTGTVLRPLFGSYIFAGIIPGDDSWKAMVYTNGVSKLLGASQESPSLLPIGWVENLLEHDGIVDRFEDALTFKRGDLVEFLDGPFKGQHGAVQWTSPQRVALLLSILGRQTCVYSNPQLLKVISLEKVSIVQQA